MGARERAREKARGLTPFPFPFERLPRRLEARLLVKPGSKAASFRSFKWKSPTSPVFFKAFFNDVTTYKTHQISAGKVSQLRLLSTTNGTAGWDSLEKQSQQCVYSIGSPKLKGYIVPFH